VFSCQTLIAGDIGKLEIQIVEEDEKTGVYQEVSVPAFSPVLRKPNGFQTWQKFIEHWLLSKLSHGNAYILKERDNRNAVVGLTVLDPNRVRPLVAPNGEVFYELGEDDLAQVPNDLPVVPASEIIHDRMWCLFHPLVGLSPIFACGLAGIQGLEIVGNSARFFTGGSRPMGILVAPGPISDELAEQYKKRWNDNYGEGRGLGKTAVLGGGMKYEAMTQNAVDSQLTEQLQMSASMICSAYHVPGYKIGVGPTPTYQNAEVLNQIYYDDCLQTLIEGVENLLDDGLGLRNVEGHDYCAKFDLDGLLRMDSATQIETLNKSVAGGWMAPNEARAKRNMLPVKGGESPMIQQQNYSLAALARRDAGPDPFASTAKPPAALPPGPDAAKAMAYAVIAHVRKGLSVDAT
jgi:HK97 family phage portal protein